MSYTTNRQPQGILQNDETFLKEGLIAELVTIKLNIKIREVISHLLF